MKHIYIFNESSRAAVYGVGTYIKQMTESLASQKDFSFYVININSEKKEFEVENNNGVKNYHIPSVPYGSNMNRYYRNSFFLLQPYIEQNTGDNYVDLFFHFNFYQEIPLIKIIKEYYPKSRIIFSIHYMNWCFMIKGNKSYFQEIIAKNVQDEADKNEIAVIENFKHEKEVFEISDKIICLAKFTENLLLEDYGIPENKLSVVFNGLKDDIVRLSRKEKSELKTRYHIQDDEKIVLYVGRLDNVKGVDIVIKAFKNIVKNKLNVRLVIVGEGDFSKYMKECRGIFGKIIFTGKIEKETLYQFYQMADVGVMPSTHEQCSYVAIEMLAHGIPLIASTTTGLKEMLSPELSHLRLNAKEEGADVMISVEECTDKISYILEQSEKKIKEIGEMCRNIYLEKYEINKMKSRLLDSVYI